MRNPKFTVLTFTDLIASCKLTYLGHGYFQIPIYVVHHRLFCETGVSYDIA